jgi:hypothetical protein
MSAGNTSRLLEVDEQCHWELLIGTGDNFGGQRDSLVVAAVSGEAAVAAAFAELERSDGLLPWGVEVTESSYPYGLARDEIQHVHPRTDPNREPPSPNPDSSALANTQHALFGRAAHQGARILWPRPDGKLVNIPPNHWGTWDSEFIPIGQFE